MAELVKVPGSYEVGLNAFRVRCAETPEQLATRAEFHQQQHPRLSRGLADDQVRCVLVPYKGSRGSAYEHVLQLNGIDKMDFAFIKIGQFPYIMVVDKDLNGFGTEGSSSKLNRTATTLACGTHIYGAVLFLMLDHDYDVTSMSLATFKKYALSLLK